jgi:hypothetical protein
MSLGIRTQMDSKYSVRRLTTGATRWQRSRSGSSALFSHRRNGSLITACGGSPNVLQGERRTEAQITWHLELPFVAAVDGCSRERDGRYFAAGGADPGIGAA